MRTSGLTSYETKTGARYRKIATDARRRKEGKKKKILFTGKLCVYLTCRLMGDSCLGRAPELTFVLGVLILVSLETLYPELPFFAGYLLRTISTFAVGHRKEVGIDRQPIELP